MTTDKLKPFLDNKYINLETFRKNGLGVQTPVWFVILDEVIYVVTAHASGKVKRLENNKHVRIAPCSFNGKLRGDWVDGEAHFASESTLQKAMNLRKKKYGWRAILAGLFISHKGKLTVIGIKI